MSGYNKKPGRMLSVFGLVMINVMAIDSVRNLPASAAMGSSILFYYVLATLVFLIPCALVTAELATHYPKTGGVYVWVREMFGPAWGFFALWLQWIYNIFWYPTILAFTAVNFIYLINPALIEHKLLVMLLTAGVFILATSAHCYGFQVSSRISAYCAILGTVLPMLLIISFGILWVVSGKPLAVSLTPPQGWSALAHRENMSFLVIIFFSLMGIEMSAIHAEAVRNPKRSFPRALFFSTVLIVSSLALASLAIAIVVPAQQLHIISGLDQAFAFFLNAFHYPALLPLIIVSVLIGSFGNMSAWIIGPTTALLVAAEDEAIPRRLSHCNKNGAPVIILMIQALVVILLCGLFLLLPSVQASYWLLSNLTAQLALLYYLLLFATAFRFQKKGQFRSDAFRIPGGLVGRIVVVGLGFLSCLIVFFLGFIPPSSIISIPLALYIKQLLLGIIIFILPAFIIYYRGSLFKFLIRLTIRRPSAE